MKKIIKILYENINIKVNPPIKSFQGEINAKHSYIVIQPIVLFSEGLINQKLTFKVDIMSEYYTGLLLLPFTSNI